MTLSTQSLSSLITVIHAHTHHQPYLTMFLHNSYHQAEHYCRSMYLAIVDSDSLDFDQNVSQDYLLAAVAGNQLASLCWRSAHAYAVYALHNPDSEEEEEPSPVVDPIEAEAFCRQTMDLIQPQFDEDSAPVAQHALECLGKLHQAFSYQKKATLTKL